MLSVLFWSSFAVSYSSNCAAICVSDGSSGSSEKPMLCGSMDADACDMVDIDDTSFCGCGCVGVALGSFVSSGSPCIGVGGWSPCVGDLFLAASGGCVCLVGVLHVFGSGVGLGCGCGGGGGGGGIGGSGGGVGGCFCFGGDVGLGVVFGVVALVGPDGVFGRGDVPFWGTVLSL